MQVEKNPLIGTQYWLSPIKIFPERVRKLAELREQYKISTPMSVLSRLINVRAYEETRTVILEEEQFWKIAESQLQFVREKENCLINDKILQQIGVADKVSFEEWVKIC